MINIIHHKNVHTKYMYWLLIMCKFCTDIISCFFLLLLVYIYISKAIRIGKAKLNNCWLKK